ncbi:MAG: hypothetical protein IV100_32145 [Myxococcales bacterium]|nr:hypothetical protein [Myxococcales bacterium]
MSESVPAKAPAPGREFQTFLSRLVKVILRPQAFWADLGTTMPPVKEVVFPHMVVLVGMQALAAFVGTLIGKGLGAAFGILITTFLTSFAGIWVFAFAAVTIATAKGGNATLERAIAFAAYSVAPILVVSVIGLIPVRYVTAIAPLLAMPFAFHVMGHGATTALGIHGERAPHAVAQLCGALVLVWTLMPMLLPAIAQAVFG